MWQIVQNPKIFLVYYEERQGKRILNLQNLQTSNVFHFYLQSSLLFWLKHPRYVVFLRRGHTNATPLNAMDFYSKSLTVYKMPEGTWQSSCPILPLHFPCRVGAVHSDEGLVHEERPRLCPGILHHSTVHLQRPSGPERTDSTSKGHRGCKCTIFTLWLTSMFISTLPNFDRTFSHFILL